MGLKLVYRRALSPIKPEQSLSLNTSCSSPILRGSGPPHHAPRAKFLVLAFLGCTTMKKTVPLDLAAVISTTLEGILYGEFCAHLQRT